MKYLVEFCEKTYYSTIVEADSFEEASETLKKQWYKNPEDVVIDEYGANFIDIEDIFEYPPEEEE